MNVAIKPLNPALGTGHTATVTNAAGQRLANILISVGVGQRAGQLGATCDCREAQSPCTHIQALRGVNGFETAQDIKLRGV